MPIGAASAGLSGAVWAVAGIGADQVDPPSDELATTIWKEHGCPQPGIIEVEDPKALVPETIPLRAST